MKGTHILLGLLLTLGLHCAHLLLLSAVSQLNRKNDVWFFYFGFTQLLYMLPAIYFAGRNHPQGIRMGLIIGASLTFLLGLPLAGLAFICGQMSAH